MELNGGLHTGEMDHDHGVIGDGTVSDQSALGFGRGLDHTGEGEAGVGGFYDRHDEWIRPKGYLSGGQSS